MQASSAPSLLLCTESGYWKSKDSLYTVVLNCVTFGHGTNVKYAPILEPIPRLLVTIQPLGRQPTF